MSGIDTNLKGKVAIVTGGSQGIGAAIAIALGQAGAAVALTYNHSKEKALKVAGEIEKRGGPAPMALPLNLRDRASIDEMVSRTVTNLGRIDILVNNAAVGSASIANYSSTDRIDHDMFEINTVGPLLCVQAVLPIMIEQNFGKIINISSVGGGITVFPKFTASDEMSKCAIGFLSKQIVADHPHRNIDAFSICPGAVNTRMFQESTLNHLSPEEKAAFLSKLPLGRLIEPEEIASLALFLCSAAGTICRGAIIDASLGLGVRPGLVSENN